MGISLKSKKKCWLILIYFLTETAGNTSENLLNEIIKVICFLYRGKEITKKAYKNIMNSIKL